MDGLLVLHREPHVASMLCWACSNVIRPRQTSRWSRNSSRSLIAASVQLWSHKLLGDVRALNRSILSQSAFVASLPLAQRNTAHRVPLLGRESTSVGRHPGRATCPYCAILPPWSYSWRGRLRMHGLKQIEVVTQGDGWHLVGLDDQGRVWFGTTRRTTKGRAITWVLMDETDEDLGPQQTPGTQPPEQGIGSRPWPSRPRA